MSDDLVIQLVDVGKMYRLHASRVDTVLDGLGLSGLLPWRRSRGQEFWALRGVDLELRRGQRLGIIGRNGAGKSTLLKILTGNIAPTEGRVEVRGRVHALIDAGGGFHPEFTGYENIRAALTYQGLTGPEISEAEGEIAEFTELGDFLSQPFKTYSLGMQARLTFATATTVKPEILIIDEILGAGDAYFFTKALERTRELVESGASVIIVSHALDQIVRLCEQAVWLERGRLVKKGLSLEVVKAYERFVRVLDDRRLRAKNRRLRVGGTGADAFGETVLVRLTIEGPVESSCEVREVTLERDGGVEERVLVGDAQDSDASHAGFVVLEGSEWSEPERTPEGCLRRLTVSGGPAVGIIAFNLPWLFEESAYGLLLRYAGPATGTVSLEVLRRGQLLTRQSLGNGNSSGGAERVLLGPLLPPGGDEMEMAPGTNAAPVHRGTPEHRALSQSRWPGEGSLEIAQVRLLGADDREQAVFVTGTPMSLEVDLVARKAGVFEVVPVAVLYRVDSIRVFSAVGRVAVVALDEGGRRTALLRLGPINLGNGRYVFSVALYRSLDSTVGGEVYDLVDRSYEFEVLGADPLQDGIFRHPAEWSVE